MRCARLEAYQNIPLVLEAKMVDGFDDDIATE